MAEGARETMQALYEALARQDVAVLRRLLAPDFEGEVTAGLPAGLGGRYHGPEAMLGVWGRVARLYDVRPEPEEHVATNDGRIVVRGRYRGHARATGRPVDAAFVHVLRVADGKLTELRQVTDSQRWHTALDETLNATLVRRVFDGVRRRDLTPLFEGYADEVEIHEAAFLPYGGVHRGREGITRHGKGFVTTWEGLQTEEDRLLDEVVVGSGETIAAAWHLKATSPDGAKRLDSPAISSFDFRGDKVVRLRMFYFEVEGVRRFLEEHGRTAGGP